MVKEAKMFVISKFLAAGFLGLTFISVPIAAQTIVPLAPFNSVGLRDGGRVTVRHGPVQRVTFVKGSLDHTQVTVEGTRLKIKSCKFKCPSGYELQLEIVTPDISGISVSDGGTIQSRGEFPSRAEIRVAVAHGGTIDIRSMTVDSVTASVNQGGRILTKPLTMLSANVANGGAVTYWGEAQVKSSIQRGGVVEKGTAADDTPLVSDSGPSLPVVPIVPKLPIQPVQKPRR
jgi:hypothetical protein